jgi:hypothetical protein
MVFLVTASFLQALLEHHLGADYNHKKAYVFIQIISSVAISLPLRYALGVKYDPE